MGMDVYFKSDIVNVLRSVASVDLSAQLAHEPNQERYHQGFEAALLAVGLAFGLEPMVKRRGTDGPVWTEMADQ